MGTWWQKLCNVHLDFSSTATPYKLRGQTFSLFGVGFVIGWECCPAYVPPRCCWTPLKCGGPCPQPRKMHTAVVAGNRLLVVGGDRDAGAALHVYRKKPSAKTHGCQAIGQRKTLCNTGQGKKTGCQTAGNRTASMSWWWPEAV
eukprot:scaffold213028_cov18-Tisochrysis_lutea.AAC.1